MRETVERRGAAVDPTGQLTAITRAIAQRTLPHLPTSYFVLYKHAHYGRPAQQMRTLYFHPVVSSIFLLSSSSFFLA